MSGETTEYIELKLKVPKAIVDFLRAYETAMAESAEQYLEYKIVQAIKGDLDGSWEDSPYFDSPSLIERFGLDKVFKNQACADQQNEARLTPEQVIFLFKCMEYDEKSRRWKRITGAQREFEGQFKRKIARPTIEKLIELYPKGMSGRVN